MPTFVPALTPPEPVRDPLHLVFRDGAILSVASGVFVASPEAHGLTPARTLYLGTLDGRPCFASDSDAGEPNGATFAPLRAAIALVDPGVFGVVSTAMQLLYFERTHLHCCRCAARLESKPGERAKKCPACGYEDYPRVAPCVITVVHDDHRILLAHRPKMPFFALVAGFVESGETLEECVAREVREEVGVEVDDITYFGSQPWPFPHQIMVGFFARWRSGDVVVDGVELDDAKWFDVDALPPIPPPLSIARKMIDAWATGTRARDR